MTIEKFIQKAYEFEKKNKSFTWKPKDFPEDMSESSTIDELVSEGDNWLCIMPLKVVVMAELTIVS